MNCSLAKRALVICAALSVLNSAIAEDFKNHMEKLAELQQERKSLEKEVSEVLDIQ